MDSGGLKDSLEALLQPKVYECKVAMLIKKLQNEELEIFNKILNSNVGVHRIALVLQKSNYHVSASSLHRHRAKVCSCQ